jgi:Zn-dependent protease
MFGRRIKLFKLFGFVVRIDLSWIIIAALITWSLAVGFFPFRYKGLPLEAYWLMGVVGAIGFFLSIILHEIGGTGNSGSRVHGACNLSVTRFLTPRGP